MPMMKTLAAAAALMVMGGAASAQTNCVSVGGTIYCEQPQVSTVRTGRYAQKPGCCANAPVPKAQYGNRRYIYPDGKVVVVYGGGRRLGKQPFWWWAVPPH